MLTDNCASKKNLKTIYCTYKNKKKDRAIVVFLFKCKKSLEGNVEITWPPRHSVRIRAPLHTLQCHGQRSTIIRLSQAKERVKVTTFRTKFKL